MVDINGLELAGVEDTADGACGSARSRA